MGEDCWLFGVLTVGPLSPEKNSRSVEESPLPENINMYNWDTKYFFAFVYVMQMFHYKLYQHDNLSDKLKWKKCF